MDMLYGSKWTSLLATLASKPEHDSDTDAITIGKRKPGGTRPVGPVEELYHLDSYQDVNETC